MTFSELQALPIGARVVLVNNAGGISPHLCEGMVGTVAEPGRYGRPWRGVDFPVPGGILHISVDPHEVEAAP